MVSFKNSEFKLKKERFWKIEENLNRERVRDGENGG